MLKLENILGASGKGGFFVPKGMIITGTFSADKSGQIAGTVNGDVFVKGKVTVLKGAIIRGDISAMEIVVYGKITGDVKCTGKAMVQPGAYIKGNISTSEIHIEKDAIVEGIITKSGAEIIVAEEPSENDTEENTGSETTVQKTARKNENASPETWF